MEISFLLNVVEILTLGLKVLKSDIAFTCRAKESQIKPESRAFCKLTESSAQRELQCRRMSICSRSSSPKLPGGLAIDLFKRLIEGGERVETDIHRNVCNGIF